MAARKPVKQDPLTALDYRQVARIRLAVDLVERMLSRGVGSLQPGPNEMPKESVAEYMAGLTLLMRCMAEDHAAHCDLRMLPTLFEELSTRPDGFVLERMAWCVLDTFVGGMNLSPEETSRRLANYRPRLAD